MRVLSVSIILSVLLAVGGCGNDSTGAKPSTQSKPWKLIRMQGIFNFVLMDDSAWKDQDQYRLAIADICGGKNMCQVLFWKDPRMIPTAMPMTDAQAAAKVAHWSYNGNTGHRQLLWSCQIVNDPSQCF